MTRAVFIREPGDASVLELVDVPTPVPGPDEVLVEVAAAGLNRADIVQRRGHYPAPPGSPAQIPGLEFSGLVKQTGERVTSLRAGDRVMGIVGGGAMATELVIHEREVLRIPEGMNFSDAAAIPEVFLTAFDALFSQGKLALGETVLVHAIASGVGTAALQLALCAGARVIGTSRREDKLERCKELGAFDGLLVSDARFADRVKALVPSGVELVVDTVGGAYFPENLQAMALKGRLVLLGLLAGRNTEIPLGELLRKRLTLMGSVLRSRPLEEKIALAQAFSAQALPLFSSGRLKPVVDRVLPMSEVREAHRLMESSDTFGKLVLEWR